MYKQMQNLKTFRSIHPSYPIDFMKMAEKRKRPFTPYEKELIREIATPYLSIIESKKTDAVYNKSKNNAWVDIAEKFNQSPQCQKATHSQLKKLWLNMKTRARDAKTIERQRMHTGGGSYIPDPSPEDDLLGDLSNIKILPTIKVIKDSDGYGDNDGDEDDDTYAKKRKSVDCIEFVEEDDCMTEIQVQSGQETKTASPPSKFTSEGYRTPASKSTSEGYRTPASKSTSEGYQTPAVPRATPQVNKKPTNTKKARKEPIPVVDSLKIQLIERDIEQREERFKQELEHSAAVNKIKLEILMLELEHKKKIYNMIEKEQAKKLSNFNSNPQ